MNKENTNKTKANGLDLAVIADDAKNNEWIWFA